MHPSFEFPLSIYSKVQVIYPLLCHTTANVYRMSVRTACLKYSSSLQPRECHPARLHHGAVAHFPIQCHKGALQYVLPRIKQLAAGKLQNISLAWRSKLIYRTIKTIGKWHSLDLCQYIKGTPMWSSGATQVNLRKTYIFFIPTFWGIL